MKRLFTIIASLILAATGAFAFSPSLDGRAVVAEKGVLPQGAFAKTVGYLPGDSISVTNIANKSNVDILVIGALDPSEGIAILLSPEAAELLGMTKGSNVVVKITKRSGQLDEAVAGTAVIGEVTSEVTEDSEHVEEAEIAQENEAIGTDDLAPTTPSIEEKTVEKSSVEESLVEEKNNGDSASNNENEQTADEIETEMEEGEATPDEAEKIEGEDIEKTSVETTPVYSSSMFDDDDEAEIIEPTEEDLVEEDVEVEPSESIVEEVEEVPSEQVLVDIPEENEPFEEEDVEVEPSESFVEEVEEVPSEEVPSEAVLVDVPEENEPFEEEVLAEEEIGEADDVVAAEPFEEEELPDEDGEVESEVVENEVVDEIPDVEKETVDVDEIENSDFADEVSEKSEEKVVVEEVPAVEMVEEQEIESESVVEDEIAPLEDFRSNNVAKQDSSEENVEEVYEPIVLVPSEPNPPVEEETENAVDSIEPVVEQPQIVEDLKIADMPVVEQTAAEQQVIENEPVAPASATVTVSGKYDYRKCTVESFDKLEKGKYYIQIAVLGNEDNIKTVFDKYNGKYPIRLIPHKNGTSKYVLIGPLSVDEYGTVLNRFKSYGYKDCFLRKIK